MRKATSIADTLSLPEAAAVAGHSRDTVLRWCSKHGIGRQLRRGAPWRVLHVALLAVANGDLKALEVFHAGDENSPLLDAYIGRPRDPESRLAEFMALLRRGDVKELAANADPELASILRQAFGQQEK